MGYEMIDCIDGSARALVSGTENAQVENEQRSTLRNISGDVGLKGIVKVGHVLDATFVDQADVVQPRC